VGKIIIWSKLALKHTEEIHKYVLENSKSLRIADDLTDKIFTSSEVLSKQPELYALDKFKELNNGSYRAYEIFHYRISYRVLKDEIRILRVRHTSREPLNH
jgi:plasmid stabilization system protein ParE